MKSENKKK